MSENLTDTSTPDEDASSPTFWPSITPATTPAAAPTRRGYVPRKKAKNLGHYAPLTRHQVMEAVLELHAAGKQVTRSALVDLLGANPKRVDEHVKELYLNGVIRRLHPGVYEPLAVFAPARPVSMTKLSDGMVKVEVGDICIDLTPPECRAIASMLIGTAFDHSLINSSRDLAEQIAELRASGHAQKQRVAKLVETMEASFAQGQKSRTHKPPHPT